MKTTVYKKKEAIKRHHKSYKNFFFFLCQAPLLMVGALECDCREFGAEHMINFMPQRIFHYPYQSMCCAKKNNLTYILM